MPFLAWSLFRPLRRPVRPNRPPNKLPTGRYYHHGRIVHIGSTESALTQIQLTDLITKQFSAAKYCADGDGVGIRVVHLRDLPRADFRALVDAYEDLDDVRKWEEDEVRHDKKPPGHIFFDTNSSRLSISVHLSRHTPLHQSTTQTIQDAFQTVSRDKLGEYESDERFMFSHYGGTKPKAGFCDFTTKEADLVIEYVPDAESVSRPFFVVEVGVTETYEELVRTLQFWRDLPDVGMVVLVKFHECPEDIGKKSFEAFSDEVLADAKGAVGVDGRGFRLCDDRCDGVMRAYGIPLIGRIIGFLELWEFNHGTGEVRRRGDRVVSLIKFVKYLATP